jgi:GntR family transcriptional repressor for pyruvate dehydrogenase complex
METDHTEKLRSLKTPSLIDKTLEILTNLIISGEFQQGHYLPTESELCESLGVGRSTLREAVKILESKGLVKRRHGKGIEVVDESKKAASDLLQLLIRRHEVSIKDLLEVRKLIEQKAAALAAARATNQNLDYLQRELQILRSRKRPMDEYLQADLNFHMAIAEATENTVLILITETIRPFIHQTIVECMRVAGNLEWTKPYHGRIYEAIKAKNPQMSAQAMLEHLEGTEELLSRAGIEHYNISGPSSMTGTNDTIGKP